MINAQYPAGVHPLDTRAEIFACSVHDDHAYCIHQGTTVRVCNAPDFIKLAIVNDMICYPDKVKMLQSAGYLEFDILIEKYARCMSGALDNDPDIVDGVFLNHEYWLCPTRNTCTMQICNPLTVGPRNQELTPKEIEHLTLISQGLYNKEIADRLNCSEETVKVHHKSIYEKTGLSNKAELTLLAYQKNLIS